MKRLLTALAAICCFLACEKVPEEIPVASVSLSQSTAEMVVGETVSLIATVLPSNATDKTVIWASSNQSVATVSGGKVTAVAEGTSTITASSGGKSATCLVTVRKQTVDVSSVELNKTELALTEGDSETLVATVKPDDATDQTVTWSSSNENVATVSGGLVRAVAEGAATITAAAGGKSAICTVTVSRKQEQYLTFLSEGTTTISMTNKGANAPVVYYSYDKSNWTRWNYGELTFTKSSPLYMYGDNPNGFGTTIDDYSIFCSSGANFSVTGNIMHLLEQTEEDVTIPSKASYCFAYLFSNCTNLTSAPELPATTLTYGCYQYMFEGCSSLKEAPELPATKLSGSCYRGMFKGCSSLKEAPELPATTLWGTCYCETFEGCLSLKEAPELPATTLKDHCYQSMFRGCENLTTAPELPATTMARDCYHDMFYDCKSLTAAPELPATTLADLCYAGMFFNCGSLATAPELLPATTLADFCYENMFRGCENLTTAPRLPATTLTWYCYFLMFCDCTNLTTAPELPATTLAGNCYNGMFTCCKSLITAPELPATTLADYCYDKMFKGCESLTTAPELPATTLMPYCYRTMFGSCTNLTTAPELPATTLADNCYSGMFSGCENLTTAPELPATTLARDCYHWMFLSCRKLITAPELPATTLTDNCYCEMFCGCNKLNYIKALFTTEPSDAYTYGWVYDVAMNGTFVKSSEATWDVTGPNGVPEGWTVETASN